MNKYIINVWKREKIGKASSKALRKSGLMPSVIYGLGVPSIAVSIEPKVVAKIIASDAGVNSIIYLKDNDGAECHAIIKDLQRHPVTGRLRHIDFLRIDPTHRVRVKVQIKLKGIPIGVKEGGILDFIHRDIEIECLPDIIPPYISINVDHLKVGESIRLDQLKLDSHITVHGDIHNVICCVVGKHSGETIAEVTAV